jgi:periplasmic protein TonB
MPRDLFGVGATPASVTRAFNRYTVIGSALLHIALVAIVLIVPLLASDVLPKPTIGRVQFVSEAFIPPNPPVAAPPRVERAFNHDAAPVVSPDRIRDEEPAPPPANVETSPFGMDVAGARPTASGFGVNLGDSMTHAAPAPPPTPPTPQKPLRISDGIRQPAKIFNVAPVYPDIAQRARIEGNVVIEAIIGTNGSVQDARIVSGSPLLNEAALNAVRQWRYTPTLLNTQPVAVIMTVTVSFKLQH